MKRVSVPLVLVLVWIMLTWLVDNKVLRPACEECSELFSLKGELSFRDAAEVTTQRISLLLLVVFPWLVYAPFCVPYRTLHSWASWKAGLQKWCQPMAFLIGAFVLGLSIEYFLYLPLRDHLWDFLRSYIERFQVVLFPLLPGFADIKLPIHLAGLVGLAYGLYVFLKNSWELPSKY